MNESPAGHHVRILPISKNLMKLIKFRNVDESSEYDFDTTTSGTSQCQS